jgi:hypothetical protein
MTAAVSSHGLHRLGVELLPIAALVLLGFAIHIPLAGYARFVVPLVPATAWLTFAVLAPWRGRRYVRAPVHLATTGADFEP